MRIHKSEEERTTIYPSLTPARSEEHTSELQSRLHLVCRLLLEKKKISPTTNPRPSLKTLRSAYASSMSHSTPSQTSISYTRLTVVSPTPMLPPAPRSSASIPMP